MPFAIGSLAACSRPTDLPLCEIGGVWDQVCDHFVATTTRLQPHDLLTTHLSEPNPFGESGEQFVLDFERFRLTRAGRCDLATEVEWSSKVQGDGLGYDVRSFQIGGDGVRLLFPGAPSIPNVRMRRKPRGFESGVVPGRIRIIVASIGVSGIAHPRPVRLEQLTISHTERWRMPTVTDAILAFPAGLPRR